jgi:uncharacterized protein YeaO (DUF488 family)
MKAVRVKRVYVPSAADDGTRILVDRLWPRGVSKEKAAIDLWLKDIAPSTELRKWFGHDPAKWDEFRKRYFRELEGKAELVAELRRAGAKGTVTLLFAAHDEEHNNAVALAEYLRSR